MQDPDFTKELQKLSCKRGQSCTNCHGTGVTGILRMADGTKKLELCRYFQYGATEASIVSDKLTDMLKTLVAVAENTYAIKKELPELVALHQHAFEVAYNSTIRGTLANLWDWVLRRNRGK